VRKLTKILKILILLIVVGVAAGAGAQQTAGNLSVDLNAKTLRVQAKAEELFDREDHRRAHVIYLNDLAPIGDKYAQYMLGFMCLSGLGVEQDSVLASAWYRLAAERGAPEEFVAIRDDLLNQLDAADRAQSDEIYRELRRKYSDLAISMREVRDAFGERSQVRTGSLLGSQSSALTIIEPHAGGNLSGDEFLRRVERRMQRYLDYITATLGINTIEAESVTATKLANLEDQVDEYLLRTDAP